MLSLFSVTYQEIFKKYLLFFYEGGLGEAVAAALSGEKDIAVQHLCVRALPRSGPSAELMDMFGISANHIVKAVKS